MKTLLGLTLLFFFAFQGFPQGIIQGKVHNAQAQEMSYANVLLLNKPDSSMVKGVVSDESGNFIFTEIPKGEYYVEVHILGYAKTHSPVFSFLGTVKLKEQGIEKSDPKKNREGLPIDQIPFFIGGK